MNKLIATALMALVPTTGAFAASPCNWFADQKRCPMPKEWAQAQNQYEAYQAWLKAQAEKAEGRWYSWRVEHRPNGGL